MADSAIVPSTAKVQHISRTQGVWALTRGILLGGRYELVDQLAKGGMSLLWAAIDRQLARAVVVKFLRTEAGLETRARFEAEARVAGSLRSPHIIEVYDVGITDGVPFMVLERLVGEDLATRLQRRGRLTLPEAIVIARQGARGLQAAHRAGVIHRDIKPSNLFLAKEHQPDAELLKILDFGVAKVLNATGGVITRPGAVVGSPHSISPEQVHGSVVDYRADLFAMAAVLYRCVVGQPPFRGDGFVATLAAVAKGSFDAPSELDPTLPRQLDAFFVRALAVSPADRFRTAVELAAAFANAAGAAAAS